MGAAILDRKSWGPPSWTRSRDVIDPKVAPILLRTKFYQGEGKSDMGREVGEKGEGSGGEGGGKWGRRGREVGGKGEGTGNVVPPCPPLILDCNDS